MKAIPKPQTASRSLSRAPAPAAHEPAASAPERAEAAAAVRRGVAAPPAALRPSDVLALQRTIGNRAVQRLLSSHAPPPRLQPVRVSAAPAARVQRMSVLEVEAELAAQGNRRMIPELRSRLELHLEEEAGKGSVTPGDVRARMDAGELRRLLSLWKEEIAQARKKPVDEESGGVVMPSASSSSAVLDDRTMKERFGFYIETGKTGVIDSNVAFTAADTGGPAKEGKLKEDGIVGSVSTIPHHTPAKIADTYRGAFTDDAEANRLFHLSAVVNYRGKAQDDPSAEESAESKIQAAVDTAKGWPTEAFRIVASGFLWHPWRTSAGQDVPLVTVRAQLGALSEEAEEEGGLTRADVKRYEASKRTDATMTPYGPARNQAFAQSSLVAAQVAPFYQNVLIHVSDPDAPNFKSRVAGRRRSAPEEIPATDETLTSEEGTTQGGTGLPEIAQTEVEETAGQLLVPLFQRYREILAGRHHPGTGALPPFVLSGGYELRLNGQEGDVSDERALTLVGHRLDLAIRDAIARAGDREAGANIYLPEPNLLLRWDKKLATVKAIFGTSNKESVFLVKNYRGAFKGMEVEIRYDLRANAPTTTPERFVLEKPSSEEPQHRLSGFSGARMTRDQLERVCNQSQCYARFETWSIAVQENFGIKAGAILPAFNACMITERYGYDPERIRAGLSSFDMPSAGELEAFLMKGLANIKGEKQRKEKATAITELLRRTGYATLRFMDRLLNRDEIADPVIASLADEVEAAMSNLAPQATTGDEQGRTPEMGGGTGGSMLSTPSASTSTDPLSMDRPYTDTSFGGELVEEVTRLISVGAFEEAADLAYRQLEQVAPGQLGDIAAGLLARRNKRGLEVCKALLELHGTDSVDAVAGVILARDRERDVPAIRWLLGDVTHLLSREDRVRLRALLIKGGASTDLLDTFKEGPPLE